MKVFFWTPVCLELWEYFSCSVSGCGVVTSLIRMIPGRFLLCESKFPFLCRVIGTESVFSTGMWSSTMGANQISSPAICFQPEAKSSCGTHTCFSFDWEV